MEVVKEIAVFLIVVNILSSLMPDDNYRRYLKMLSGIILILIVIQPLHVFFDDSELEDLVERQIKESNIVELDKSLSGINEEIGNSAKKLYEEEVKNSIGNFLEKNGILTDTIEIDMEINESDELVISGVFIEVDGNTVFDENGKYVGNYAMETRAAYIKNLVADAYGIDMNLIVVE